MNKSITELIAEWLKGQPFQNVMTVLLLALISGLGYAVVYDLIPSERRAIEAMVDRIDERHTEAARDIEDKHTRQIERVTDSFERALDRIDRPAVGGRGGVAAVEQIPD